MIWLPVILFIALGIAAKDHKLDLESGAEYDYDESTTIKLKEQDEAPLIEIEYRF